jgi:hypothetical protein
MSSIEIEQIARTWLEEPDKYLAPKAKKQKLPLTFDNLMKLVDTCQELADKDQPEGYTRVFRLYGRVLMPFLNPTTYVVLQVLIEEIYGWHHDTPQDGWQWTIKLDRFVFGQTDEVDGMVQYIALGCGLSEDTVKAHLKILERFRIARKLKGNNPDDNYGNTWFLEPDYSQIDWQGLWDGEAKKKQSDCERIAPGRNARKITKPPVKTKRSR